MIVVLIGLELEEEKFINIEELQKKNETKTLVEIGGKEVKVHMFQ